MAKNLGYSDYIKIKNFPLLRMGPYKGGFIVKQNNIREHPIGKVAERLVGNEKKGAPELLFSHCLLNVQLLFQLDVL